MRFEIGNGEFHVGDCFDVMRDLPDGSVDMILCDLPYGTTACAWDSVLPLDQLWAEYRRVTKPNAAIVLTAAQPFTSALVMSNVAWLRYEWIWRKNQGVNPMSAKHQPMRNHESILVFYRSKPTYNPQMWQSTPYGGFKSHSGATIGEVYGKGVSRHRDNPDGTRYPLTVQDWKMEKGLHPTQKPVALFEYMIRTYTHEGMTVLDNTAGSGTTAVAAENSGRRWICIERDEGYAAKAVARIRDHVSGESQPVKKVTRKPRVPLPAPTHNIEQVALF